MARMLNPTHEQPTPSTNTNSTTMNTTSAVYVNGTTCG